MHADVGTSAFFMLQGNKRWIFFPPSETMFLFPTAHANNAAYNTQVDVWNYSFEYLKQFPVLSLARGFSVVLEPGDVLFFPSLWWHAVENLDITVGLDIAIIDPVGSLYRNFPLAIGTVLNPVAVFNTIKSMLTTAKLGAKLVYFSSYFKQEEEFQEYIQQFQ